MSNNPSDEEFDTMEVDLEFDENSSESTESQGFSQGFSQWPPRPSYEILTNDEVAQDMLDFIRDVNNITAVSFRNKNKF